MKSIIISLTAVFFVFFLQIDVLSQPTHESSGKTLGEDVSFEAPPHLRIVSKDSVNGKPLFDYFIYIKAKLNGVYDINGGLTNNETFNIAQIDVWGADDAQRFWMDMHQSQLRIRGEHQTAAGNFIGYLEGDFWGGSKRFRLRHLWFEYKFMHFGQDWSFFGDKEIWPNVFDWDGPPSGVWRREPELRFMFPTEDGWQYEFGIAHPGAEITLSSDIDSTLTSANQTMPDIIAAINKKTSFGHLRLTGIFRNLKYTHGSASEAVPGYGASVSGYIKTNPSTGNSLQFQFVGGTGIATYLVSFSGLNYDAAPDGKGNMKSIPTFGGWAAYEHWLSKQWHFNIVAGFSWFQSGEISSYSITGPGYETMNTKANLTGWYSLINIMYDPLPNLSMGIEWNYGSKSTTHEGTIITEDGTLTKIEKSRSANRISFGTFFNF